MSVRSSSTGTGPPEDDYLEELFDAEQASPARRYELSRRADEQFLSALARHPSAVAVSSWRRQELSATSGTPTDRFPPNRRLIEIWCDCPAEVAAERFFARVRHSAHGDRQRDRAATIEQFRRLARAGPIGLCRVVSVDATTSCDADAVVRRLDES